MISEKSKKLSKDVIRIDTEYWHFYIKNSEEEHRITGKYLFFSDDKKELEKIAVQELESNGFFHAKIRTDKHKKRKRICIMFILCR